MQPITRLLVANRGEIACRVMRTAKAMGLSTVAVHSDIDAEAKHVAMADAAVAIGPAPAAKSYLRGDAVIEAALASGADAIHPGYGFLSENAAFARMVKAAGLIWVGPEAATIEAMGDKERARALAAAAGVPVLPGSARISSDDISQSASAAEAVGYPLLVKAAAGGGGIGMRVVETPDQLARQVEATQQLAGRLFSDPAVYLERYVPNARHVEVQIFGLGNGHSLHLFDRDCTLQRRFQKIIEEAPAPRLPDTIIAQMHDAARRLTDSQRYAGAGTLEFIYDVDREDFYFLEMNTRIQVEHTVTEMITGIDLVRWQIELAAGAQPQITQAEINSRGHAIQARIYAERPAKNFLPSPGRLTHLSMPTEADDLRVDTGIRAGDAVTPHYDPMIAKMIAWGATREDAIARLDAALAGTIVEGVEHNVAFLREALTSASFREATMTTRFVEQWQTSPRFS